MERIRISVRNLVEFLLRSGDIDNRKGGMKEQEAMQMGSRIHRKIQRQMGSDYQAEVALKEEFDCGDYILSVEGRADGIQTLKDGILIDEIKGIYRDVFELEGAYPLHLAQAKCYAAIYGRINSLEQIAIQITYCNLESEDIRRFRDEYEMKYLREWYEMLIEKYKIWCGYKTAWKQERQASIKKLKFPFAYRDGQKDLAAAVYRTIAREKKLFIQAPTGVGKTISTVFPAVKAMGENKGDMLFYLTAKTITRTVAMEAFELLKQQNLKFKVLMMTAKEKMCPMEETECNPEYCPYANGHYDRVNDAVFAMLQERESFTREDILELCEAWKVCPHETALDLSLWMDAVICDYNYVFDPRAKLKRFFGDSVKGDYLFLIDEAHNLVERGREMFSAGMEKETFLEMKRLVKTKSVKLGKSLEACNKVMLGWKRECEDWRKRDNIGELILPLMNLIGEMEKYLENLEASEERTSLLDFYFQVSAFLDVYDRVDDHYVIYTDFAENGHFRVRLYCVDTSHNLQECLDKSRSSIFFSATLIPVTYYMGLLGEAADDYAVYAKSPFLQEQKCVLIGTDVSSRYTRRGIEEYERISSYIIDAMNVKKGNYLIFFPSYKMMEEVGGCFERKKPEGVQSIYQSSKMKEQEREDFLEMFEKDHTEGLAGFCVMGGIFGEGIDLTEDRLIGAIIVGTGLPQICREREILKQYYDEKNRHGFEFSYLIPGMNKVLQSAGRVIRTCEDRGIILLLDDRFAKREYVDLFPREWEDYDYCNLGNVKEKIEQFWTCQNEKAVVE